jgi:hypothetical protein
MVAVTALIAPLFLCTPVMAVSELQEAKDTAFEIEGYLERLQAEAYSAFSRGELGTGTWEEFCALSSHARTLQHMMTMSLLLYEEAPARRYRGFVLETTLSLTYCIVMLNNLCDAAGIDTEAPEVSKTAAMPGQDIATPTENPTTATTVTAGTSVT